ncbi:GNAT family N-acetyltransferase [Jeotgalibacillus aurantiacus]|uniref:GNAT family N-acetyltransferase n=1 Tax=Jeotgalibacillus aurantiacus TaxID=2763266 RepID=UPI001D09D198|nr:GNAT family N-acetyltransferase [Jeotgalibacillus aurantiacus]
MLKRTTDVDVIASLNKPVHDLHVKLHPDLFVPYSFEAMRDAFLKILEHGEHEMYVLDEDAGFVWFEIRRREANAFKKEVSYVYVHQISVSPAYQKKGYGALLMGKVEEAARERGINRVQLDYWSSNTDAAAFYRHQGFDVLREVVEKRLD